MHSVTVIGPAKRCRFSDAAIAGLRKLVGAWGYELQLKAFDNKLLRYQAEVLAKTDIFIAAHGAALTNIPLLPEGAAVFEMFNCGHFAYGFQNMARACGISYNALRRPERGCNTPTALTGSTPIDMTGTSSNWAPRTQLLREAPLRYRPLAQSTFVIRAGRPASA